MHEIEKYNGRRIRPGSVAILVQFDTAENMDRWLARMRRAYTPNQFSPHVNRDALIVGY